MVLGKLPQFPFLPKSGRMEDRGRMRATKGCALYGYLSTFTTFWLTR
jgi:hypothetical protein